jgi:hypothetical protein
MRIVVSTSEAAPGLADYLRRCECIVEIVGDRTLEVTLSDSSRSDRDMRFEVGAYLRVWLAMHPKLEGALVAPDAAGEEESNLAL